MSRVKTGGKTVVEAQAQQLMKLVEDGMPLAEAEGQVGTTLASLRNRGGLTARVKHLMDNVAQADMLNEQNQRVMARARLVELALQDEDPKTALGASRALAGTDMTVNAVQVNALPTDPAILEALKSLKFLVEDKANGTDGTGTGSTETTGTGRGE